MLRRISRSPFNPVRASHAFVPSPAAPPSRRCQLWFFVVCFQEFTLFHSFPLTQHLLHWSLQYLPRLLFSPGVSPYFKGISQHLNKVACFTIKQHTNLHTFTRSTHLLQQPGNAQLDSSVGPSCSLHRQDVRLFNQVWLSYMDVVFV